MAKKTYAHLGAYSDLVTVARKAHKLLPLAKPGKATQKLMLDLLAFDPAPAKPRDVKIEKRWTRDGLDGELITWSVGYGPRTEAWLLKPAGATGRLPGAIALHDHGGFKFLGKEKVAIGPDGADRVQNDWHTRIYGGKAFANELARRGFVVLVPDCFMWGSRKIPLEAMPEWDREIGLAMHTRTPMESNPPALMPADVSLYSWNAVSNENTMQKYCNVLGTSVAGVIAYEDRVAANYLAHRKDVKPGGVGNIGLSGGGLRSTLLHGTSKDTAASVTVGLMTTYDGLLDHNVVSHTWMLYPTPEFARRADWPDLAACRAPAPLMVQFDIEDALFTLEGMKAADRRIAGHYKSVGKPKNYEGRFYPGPHKFDLEMQEDAFAFLAKHLG